MIFHINRDTTLPFSSKVCVGVPKPAEEGERNLAVLLRADVRLRKWPQGKGSDCMTIWRRRLRPRDGRRFGSRPARRRGPAPTTPLGLSRAHTPGIRVSTCWPALLGIDATRRFGEGSAENLIIAEAPMEWAHQLFDWIGRG